MRSILQIIIQLAKKSNVPCQMKTWLLKYYGGQRLTVYFMGVSLVRFKNICNLISASNEHRIMTSP